MDRTSRYCTSYQCRSRPVTPYNFPPKHAQGGPRSPRANRGVAAYSVFSTRWNGAEWTQRDPNEELWNLTTCTTDPTNSFAMRHLGWPLSSVSVIRKSIHRSDRELPATRSELQGTCEDKQPLAINTALVGRVLSVD